MRVAILTAVFLAAVGVAAESVAVSDLEVVHERLLIRTALPPQCSLPVHPDAARDIAPGAGIFEYCTGSPVLNGYRWPQIAVGQNRTIHMACLDSTGNTLFYSRAVDWCTWDPPIALAMPQPNPEFPTHNVVASKASEKVCATWVYACPTGPMPGFYRVSTDGGDCWGPSTELPWPSAFGGDTATSFHVSSLFPFYDSRDGLHIVVCVHPVVNDTGYIMPAEIWHWCPDNTPNWSRIHRAGCRPENMQASVGYNALYACRPSLGECDGYVLIVTWEQFDSSNVEPRTNRLRADAFVAFSSDNGQTWEYQTKLTTSSSVSHRFPSVEDRNTGRDTVCIFYLQDECAGFFVLGEGPPMNNPVVTHDLIMYMRPYPGRVDTVGGTTYDMQLVGPSFRSVCCSPAYGVHCAWNYSASDSRTFPDLNVRYNFYDYASSYWNWIDPDYMQSGVNVFTQKTGCGCLDADPFTDVAIVSGQTLGPAGVEEKKFAALFPPAGATMFSGNLRLSGIQPAVLLDITGRKRADLLPGKNDIRFLSSGVYFLRREKDRTTTKVIVQR